MDPKARVRERERRESSDRKPYSTPRIDDFGSLIEITKTGGGTSEDSGGGSFDFSGG